MIGAMQKTFFVLGGLLALVAVGAGAFGAHALGERLEPGRLKTFETASRYQMYHALALLAVAWAVGRWGDPLAVTAGWLFVAGTVLFSGSLYVLVLADLRWMGAVTPLGGGCFLAGWALLVASVLRA